MTSARYDSAYFEPHDALTRRSAEVIVPLVMELLAPRSVCDVGCGLGIWLSVFQEHGAAEVLGIDGEYVGREKLTIDPERFVAADLERGLPGVGRFDLAVSLEVAEHLSEAAAAGFVDGLVALAPAVLFSAAIPGQGGRRHLNEQWPEYWRAQFARHGYLPIDCIRPRIWQAREVRLWYRQNMLLFASRTLIEAREALKRAHEESAGRPLSVVHPGILEMALERPWDFLRKLTGDVETGQLTREERDEKLEELLKRFADRARAASIRQYRDGGDR
jgi:SAM-dependent methyltransferase